jgi:hypothetical protein
VTVSVEMLQFYVVPGRDADSSDIVANSLGAAIGIAAVDLRRLRVTPPAHFAGRVSGFMALVICIGAAAVQWALTPTFPHSVYYEQIAPDLPGTALFDGTVITASFDSAPFIIGRMSAQASAAMRDSLLAGGVVIVATIQPGTSHRDIAPIVDAHDQQRREIFMLARHGDDLMFRLRRRTDLLRLHTPSAVLADALPTQLSPSDTVVVRATTESGATTLDAIGRGPHPYAKHRRVGVGIWDAWRLLIPDAGWWATHAESVTLFSMIVLFWPIGYWAGRAARREGIPISVTATGMPIVASLAIIPWAAGAPVADWPIWAAGTGGAALGWGVGRWIVG